MNSFVFIKVSKCGTETVRKFIRELYDEDVVLDSSYDKIFEKEKKTIKI